MCIAGPVELNLQRQTSLNGGVTALLLPTVLAARRWHPNHLGIKPDRYRSAPLQAVIIRRPILGLVLGTCQPGQSGDPADRWFNNRRLLEPIGNIPPAEAEANFYAALEGTVALISGFRQL